IKKINEEKSKLKVIAELKEVEPTKQSKNTNKNSKKTDEDDDENEAIIGDLVKNSDKEETKNQKKQTVFNEEKIGNENEAKINYSNKEPSTSQEYMQKLNDVANNIVQNNLNTI
ncbi:MAG: hypothetical protein ACKN9I_03920, partial [Alphaproteobacteria bacterium]